jgi:periplasmic divalent cation tolerance protein
MNKAVLVLISCEDKGQAERIGELLLKKKLAACTQVVEHVDSMFLWPPKKNMIDYATEALLLVKTLDSKWVALEKEIIKEHSYENPEIIAIPLTHVTKKYLSWLASELS